MQEKNSTADAAPPDDSTLDGKVLFVPTGREDEDADALADAVAATRKFYGYNGKLVLLHEGKLYEATPNLLREAIVRYVVTAKLTNRNSTGEPYWVCGYEPYSASERELRGLLGGTERPLTVQRARGSSLLVRVPKV
jgi:hypothetical protein